MKSKPFGCLLLFLEKYVKDIKGSPIPRIHITSSNLN